MKNISKLLFVVFGVSLWLGPIFAVAQEACGVAYCSSEPIMSSGGSNDVNSSNYSGRATIGDTALPANNEGNSDSTNNQSYGGGTTTTNPELEITLPATSISLGVLGPNAPSTGSATFSVRAYLSSSYAVYTIGNPPTASSGRALNALTSGGASSPGTEQFGINLVANSNPSVGANPVQTPGNTEVGAPYSFGAVAANYATANTFRYNSGEIIAQSASSSGVTTYTISYLVNINPVTTPAGRYIFNQSLVVTGTY